MTEMKKKDKIELKQTNESYFYKSYIIFLSLKHLDKFFCQ